MPVLIIMGALLWKPSSQRKYVFKQSDREKLKLNKTTEDYFKTLTLSIRNGVMTL